MTTTANMDQIAQFNDMPDSTKGQNVKQEDGIFFEKTLPTTAPKIGIKYVGVEIVKVVAGGWAESEKIEIDDELWEMEMKGTVGDNAGGGETAAEVNAETKWKRCDQMTEKEKLAGFLQPRPIKIKFFRPYVKDSYYERELPEEEMDLGMENKYTDGGDMRVDAITPNKWAEKNGVLVGDLIIQINGNLIAGLEQKEVDSKLKGERPLKVQFKRPHPEKKEKVRSVSKETVHTSASV